jgi:hypothetical protein
VGVVSQRKPDTLDKELIEALHILGLQGINLGDRLRRSGEPEKGDRYRRIGQMLEAMSYQIRDPLLVALWEYTGGGNNRLIWSNELNRREGAAAAVYLLMKHDGQKAAHACKVVAKVTGENAETLRGRFKGKALADCEKSPDGALTFQAIENMHRDGFGAEDDWRGLYGIFVQAASSLTPDMQRDARRVRSNWLKAPGR